jgi:hypothetical protein
VFLLAGSPGLLESIEGGSGSSLLRLALACPGADT